MKKQYLKYFEKQFFIIYLLLLNHALVAQTTQIKVRHDSVIVANGELKIDNSSKNINGFLFNNSNGVSKFKALPVFIDSIWNNYDTLSYKKAGIKYSTKLSSGNSKMLDPGLNGILARTGSGITVARNLIGYSENIVVENFDGTTGNPLVKIGANVSTLTTQQTLTNKRISGLRNTFINLPPSALANNSITIVTGVSGTTSALSNPKLTLGMNDTINFPNAGVGITQGFVNNTQQTFDGDKIFNSPITLVGSFKNDATITDAVWAIAGFPLNTNIKNLQMLGTSGIVGYRRFAYGTTNFNGISGNDYGGTIFGTEIINIASSGMHHVFANVAINPLSIGNGAGSLLNAATLFIKGAAQGAANNYSLWSTSGNIRLDLGNDGPGDLFFRYTSPIGISSLARLPIGSSGQILEISNMNTPSWTSNAQILRTVENTGNTSYSIALVDKDKTKLFTSPTAVVITIPSNAAMPIPLDTEFELVQFGTGELSISAASGVTLNSAGNKLKAAMQYSTLRLKKTGIDTWLIKGDLKL